MLTLTVVFVILVLIVDLCVDIHERFTIGKKRSIWDSTWAYLFLIAFNLSAIVLMTLVVTSLDSAGP